MRLGAEAHAAVDAARAGGRVLDHWFGRVEPVRLKSGLSLLPEGASVSGAAP